MALVVLGTGHLARIVAECFADDGQSPRTELELGITNALLGHHSVILACWDTPISAEGVGCPDAIEERILSVAHLIQKGATIAVMSQIPVGFTRRLAQLIRHVQPDVSIAYVPENVRGTDSAEAFRGQGRVVIGTESGRPLESIGALMQPYGEPLWMDLESAEMSKHALNGYLGMMIAYANEIGRLCEAVGADPALVEAAVKRDLRVSDRAPLRSGEPFSTGHLERDLHVLVDLAARCGVSAELIGSILWSNTHEIGRQCRA